MPTVEQPKENSWEPRIIAFFCNWCTYTAADLAGVSRLRYAPNARASCHPRPPADQFRHCCPEQDRPCR